MKKLLHLSTLLLLSWCLSLAGMQQAWASHAQAGQLSYTYVSTAANGAQTYRVKVEFYRDCSGISAPTSFNLTTANSCGGTGPTAVLNQVGQPTIGSPYCASVQALAVCPLGNGAPIGSPANFATYVYQNTVVLPPAAEWILSVEESARPSVTNITAGTLRLEARLYSRITPVGGGPAITITNNSPAFSTTNLPVPFVYVNQPATISFAAIDSDRQSGPNNLADSLVYSLDRPLNGCNSFETYSAYPGSGCVTRVDPRCNSRIINCIGSPANYSQTLPISVANDTIYENGLTTRPACPSTIVNATVRPRFSFTASQASFTFTPNRYLNTPSANGDNKYAVVGKVTEYRKINGRYYVVGTSRRDFLVIVIDGTGNTVPANPTGSAGPPRSGIVLTITSDTLDLEVKTCNYSRVRFNFTDPDNTSATPPSPLQNLTVFYPADINTNLLQGGDIGTFVLSRDGTPTPSATFYFQPISSLAGTTVLIPLRIEDDGCPAKGIQYRTLRIHIVNFRGAEAQASIAAPGLPGSAPNPAICPGGSLTIQGSVNRPDSVRVATTGAVILQSYSYQWVALNRTPAQAGLPALTNTQNIAVAPTVTTRYRLFISPLLGFGIGLCGDTISVLVRVAPEPVAAITLADPLTSSVCGGAQVALRGSVTRSDQFTDTYTYRWTGPTNTTIATTQNTTITAPTAPGTYTYQLTVQGQTAYGCDNTTSIQIVVVPPPVVTITRSLPQVCAGASVVLTGTTTRPAGSGSNLADTYTYQWSGPGVPANSTSPTLTVTPTALGINSYTLTSTGTSRYNCSATQTVQVQVVPQPTLVVTTDNAFVCPGGTANLRATATAPNGFTDVYTYTWSGGGLPAGTTGATLAVRPTANTTYTVTATGNAQTGCVNSGTVQVQVPPVLQADFVTADSVGTNGQHTNRPPVFFTFTNRTLISAQPSTATFSYRWTYQRIKDITGAPVTEPETVFNGPSLPATTTPAPLQLGVAGTYRIRLTATATVGGAACTPAVKERLVIVPDLQVPNIITPNGDDRNDVFKVSTANTLSKLEIYNRWGRKVYEQANYANNWGGDNQPAGVYYYFLTDRNGAQTKGWIEVVR